MNSELLSIWKFVWFISLSHEYQFCKSPHTVRNKMNEFFFYFFLNEIFTSPNIITIHNYYVITEDTRSMASYLMSGEKSTPQA